MHIAFVTGNYPTPARPNTGTFVQQFVWAMARQGHECTVIHPTSVFDRRHGRYPPRRGWEHPDEIARVEVLRPHYLSFSSKKIGPVHTGRWTQDAVRIRVLTEIGKLPRKPDLVYGHFLYDAGRVATVAAKTLGVPSVIGVGEGTFWTVTPYGFERARCDFADTSGFIAVATHVRAGLIKDIGVPEDKIVVEPNGVDLARFAPGSRADARARLRVPSDLFLVAFVGTFDELKGGAELLEAVQGIEGLGVAMIGSGPCEFSSNRIVFKGRVRHEEIPTWLNAADIFVLPTREEGSCNAVIEAMACGLPIVTSDGSYMDDLVDETVALRVDPTDVRAIRTAVLRLMGDQALRNGLRDSGLQKARQFDINRRAKRISAWMRESIIRRQGAGSPKT